MSLSNEFLGSEGSFEAVLKTGTETLSNRQSVPFAQYTKIVLSQDGYVFWVNAGISQNFIGSLHLSVDRLQEEDQTIGKNTAIFTSESEITAFNSIAPTTMWIGTWQTESGNPLSIAFSKRGRFYERANVWHYTGDIVYPPMLSQIINSMSDLPVEPIVSNSLPIWLTQNALAPVYPSFLIPDNVTPPYIVAHIPPENTVALGPFPIKGWPGNVIPGSGTAPLYNLPVSQLMKDTVKFTFYGFTNQMALQFVMSLIDYSLNTDNFGFMSDTDIKDDKRPQVEIAAIAMKKTLILDVSYYQATADAIARRQIESALVPSFNIS